MHNPICGSASVWPHQFAGDVRADTRYERIPDHAGFIPVCQSASLKRDLTMWYEGLTLL